MANKHETLFHKELAYENSEPTRQMIVIKIIKQVIFLTVNDLQKGIMNLKLCNIWLRPDFVGTIDKPGEEPVID